MHILQAFGTVSGAAVDVEIQQGSDDDGVHIKADAEKASEGGSSPFVMVNNFIKSTHLDTPCSEIVKQGEIPLWTNFEGNCSTHDGDGTIGHTLTMHIAKGLSLCECACHACIAHLDPNTSEQEEREKKFTSIPGSSTPR